MSDPYQVASEVKVTIGAGTAIKFGFFAAFGVVLFSLIISLILFGVGFGLNVIAGVPIPSWPR